MRFDDDGDHAWSMSKIIITLIEREEGVIEMRGGNLAVIF